MALLGAVDLCTTLTRELQRTYHAAIPRRVPRAIDDRQHLHTLVDNSFTVTKANCNQSLKILYASFRDRFTYILYRAGRSWSILWRYLLIMTTIPQDKHKIDAVYTMYKNKHSTKILRDPEVKSTAWESNVA